MSRHMRMIREIMVDSQRVSNLTDCCYITPQRCCYNNRQLQGRQLLGLATDRPGAALQKPAACALLKTAVDCAQFYAVLQAAVTISCIKGAAAHSDMLRLLIYARWCSISSSRHGS